VAGSLAVPAPQRRALVAAHIALARTLPARAFLAAVRALFAAVAREARWSAAPALLADILATQGLAKLAGRVCSHPPRPLPANHPHEPHAADAAGPDAAAAAPPGAVAALVDALVDEVLAARLVDAVACPAPHPTAHGASTASRTPTDVSDADAAANLAHRRQHIGPARFEQGFLGQRSGGDKADNVTRHQRF
jgi:hypothetical protein